MNQEDNIAPIIGMAARASRPINKGDRFHFFINGKKHFGAVDSQTNSEVYIRTVKHADTLNEYGRREVITMWYIINKRWLLTPADLFSLLN